MVDLLPEDEADVERSVAATLAANSQDEEQAFVQEMMNEVGDTMAANVAGVPKPVMAWIRKLPKNITGGAFKAAINTIDLASELPTPAALGASVGGAVKKAVTEGEAPTVESLKPKPLSETMPELWKSLNEFHDAHLGADNAVDEITQGVAQFAIPFTGWAKAAGVAKGASFLSNVGRVAGAEAITVGSAFDPHEGRFADLIEMGRQSESKLGDVLRRMTPDGSAANAYIQWMTDRENEGRWEGRFKNIVDNAAVSAVTGGLLMTAVKSFKRIRAGFEAPPAKSVETPVAEPVAPKSTVAVHPSETPGYSQIVVDGKPLIELESTKLSDLLDELNVMASKDKVKAAPVANKGRTNNASGATSEQRRIELIDYLESFVEQKRKTNPDAGAESHVNPNTPREMHDTDRMVARYVEKYFDELPEEIQRALGRENVKDLETGELLNALEDSVRGGHIGQLRRLRDYAALAEDERAGRSNNASGESAASLEAIGRVAEEKALGRIRVLIDRDGTVRPLTGVDAVDARAREGQIIVQKNIGTEPWTVIDRDSALPKTQLQGRLNAAKAALEAVGE